MITSDTLTDFSTHDLLGCDYDDCGDAPFNLPEEDHDVRNIEERYHGDALIIG